MASSTISTRFVCICTNCHPVKQVEEEKRDTSLPWDIY